MSVAVRQQVERRIARRVIRDCLAAGYTISVNDGGETTLKCSRTPRRIVAAMMTTDEDYLLIHRRGEKQAFGWVRFIYGNDGPDVINDYTTNLESVLTGANKLADSLS